MDVDVVGFDMPQAKSSSCFHFRKFNLDNWMCKSQDGQMGSVLAARPPSGMALQDPLFLA